jgi:hypothetical protein
MAIKEKIVTNKQGKKITLWRMVDKEEFEKREEIYELIAEERRKKARQLSEEEAQLEEEK